MTKKKGTAYEKLVAEIVGSFFHENCTVSQGSWVDGPDGRRDMDVLIEGVIEGKILKILVECKDYDKSKTGRVGIELIDALDSKRNDLLIDKCLICSNSGFTDPALRKAKRKGIGVISVLQSKNQLIKIEIIEKIYYQVVKIENVSCTFHSKKRLDEFDPSNVLYKKLPVNFWIEHRMYLCAANSNSGKKNDFLNKIFRLKHPLEVKSKGKRFLVFQLEGTMEISRNWYSTNVRLDAKSAIYNYLSGQITLSSGENSFHICGVDITERKRRLEEEIPTDSELGVIYNENKERIVISLFEGLSFKYDQIPNLNPYIVEEDMSVQ